MKTTRCEPRIRPGVTLPGRSHLLALAVLLGVASSSRAHDPPEEYFDRNVTVRMEPACVRVIYRLELSQVSLFNLPKRDERIKVTVPGRSAYEQACLDRFKVVIPDKLIAFLNGKPLTWAVEKAVMARPKDGDGAAHFHLVFRADWKPAAGENNLEVTDANFEDAPGPYRMKVDADDLEMTSVDEPREWSGKGPNPNKEPKAGATFKVEGEALAKPPSPTPEPEPPPPPGPPPSFWERLRNDDLTGLLSNNYGLWLVLLLALVHGAGHSLMPGHGKTMVAAYLVGERGTPWHAVLLGVVTTLTHTSAAIIVAIVIRYTTAKADTVNSVLLFAGGLTMAGIGIWLFLQRLAGRSDHVHLFDMGHAHSHGGEPVAAPAEKMGAVRLILLGVAGGIIPCWGAIVWVIGCIATSQFWLALPVVLAFSVGLSMVLILIGLSVVYSGRLGSSRWGGRPWFKRLVRWLPVFGAVVVTVIGLIMCATSGIGARPG